jgi:cell division transport system permease protein
MMGWIAQHRQALGDTLRRFARQPAATLFTAFAIGVALSLPAGLYVALANLAHLAGDLPARPELSIYMNVDAGEKAAAVIRKALKAHKGIEASRFVPRDEALKQLSQAQGLADVAESLDANPLPDAWVITPRDIGPEALEALQTELAKLPRVEHVRLDSQWARRLDAFLDLGRALVVTLSIFLAMALASISGNTIRMQILTRRDEIEVSRLIGATDRYIRRPFLYSGALLGASGGLAALLLLGLAHLLLQPSVARLAEQYAINFQILGLGRFDMAVLLLASTLLGWVGAHFAVTRALAKL